MDIPLPLQASREQLVALRHDLHAHPELAFHEHRTGDRVAAFLESRGIETHRGLAGTGKNAALAAGRVLGCPWPGRLAAR